MSLEEIQNFIKVCIVKSLEQNGESLDQAELGAKTQIFGEDSVIDSLDLIGIIIALEEKVKKLSGKDITVINEESIVSGETPFESIESLANLVFSKIND
jgi:acyl carrier protein